MPSCPNYRQLDGRTAAAFDMAEIRLEPAFHQLHRDIWMTSRPVLKPLNGPALNCSA
jgi:hypothetical protein